MLYEEIKRDRTHIPEGVRKIYEAVIKDDRSLVINDLSIDNNLVPDGSLLIDSSSYKMKIKKNGAFEAIEPVDLFMQEAIEGLFIKKNSVNGNRIQQFSISRDRIQQESLTSNEIENSSILGSKIKNDTIESRHIRNSAITTNHLLNESVTQEKIKKASIKSDHLSSRSVSGEHIKSAAIEESHIETNAVTSNKIKDASVQGRHIENKTITGDLIANDQIAYEHLKPAIVMVDTLANNSVSTEKLQNYCATSAKIQARAVTSEKIALKSIEPTHLGDDLKDRIQTSVQIIDSVASAPIFYATDSVRTRHFSAAGDTYLNYLRSYGNIDVDGKIYSRGDISTDGRIFRATFNDLAEAYEPGEKMTPGDIVAVKEDEKIYKSNSPDDMIVGVVSDCYADCYGASIDEIESGQKIPVGLIGKVPVKIKGAIKLGEYVVVEKNGVGRVAENQFEKMISIGRALKSKPNEDEERVLCLIFPH